MQRVVSRVIVGSDEPWESGELCDMEKDPTQYTNLFSKPEYTDLVEALKKKLKAKRDKISKNDLVKELR